LIEADLYIGAKVDLVIVIAVLSGILQVAGYGTYLVKAISAEINPNPTSWLMWAYGTALIFALEWDRGATAAMLILPGVCACSSLVVAGLCAKRGTLRWPTERSAKASLASDIILTIAYLAIWLLVSIHVLTPEQKEFSEAVILTLGVSSTLVTFVPMIVSTKKDPSNEHRLPWVIWSLAYAMSLLATVFSDGWTLDLAFYPLLTGFLHIAMASYATKPVYINLTKNVTPKLSSGYTGKP
jgi:hypothetical protein